MSFSASQTQSRVVPDKGKRPAGWLRKLDAAGRRLLDVVAAAVGLLLLAPFFALIAVLIKRDSEGPVFYRGPRVGKGGERFGILKFRTMYERPESYDGPKITGSGDGRITPVGQWLRDTKLNELPQLWNVLVGEMSLVGPRPEDPDFVAAWPEGTREELLATRPGITSPASVLYRDEEAMLQSGTVVADYLRDIMPGKLRLDLVYVRHRTLLNDLDIIFWTLVTLLPALKRKRVPEHSLFWGPLSRLIRRHFSWFVVDLLIALASVVAAGVIWRSGQPLDLGVKMAVAAAFIIAFLFSAVNLLLGLDQVYWSKAPAAAAFDLAFSCGLATGIVVLANHFAPGGPLLPGGMLSVTGLFVLLGCISVRYRTRILTGVATRWLNVRGQSRAVGERVLVVGAGEVGDFATWLLRKGDMAQFFSLVGMVDDAPRKQGARMSGLKILGSTADIPALVQRHDVGLVLFAIADIEAEERQRILDICRNTPAHVVLVPDVLETLRFHFVTAPQGPAPPITEDVDRRQLRRWVSDLDELIQAQAWGAAQAKVEALQAHLDNGQL